MPSIQYQFRVNSDADGFLFESLENVPANQRSAFIREKLVIGILSSANVGFKPALSVTQAENKPVLPSAPELKTPADGFGKKKVMEAAPKTSADPLPVGNTQPVLPMPTANPLAKDPNWLAAQEKLRRNRAEAAAKLNHPTPEIAKKG